MKPPFPLYAFSHAQIRRKAYSSLADKENPGKRTRRESVQEPVRFPGESVQRKLQIASKLKRARGELGLTQRELAMDSDLSAIASYEAGSSVPGGLAIAALVRRGVNATWLLSPDDRGAPLLRDQGSSSPAHSVRSGYVRLPLYGVEATGGHGAEVEREEVVDVIEFKESWLRQEFNAGPRDVALLFVRGHSMEPDLRPGDVIMIDRRDKTAQYEATYVLRMDGALLVKQLQRLPGGKIRVVSKGVGYDTWEINLSALGESANVAIIGRVIYACRRF